MLVSIAVLVLLTGLVAVFAGPTESDSISYHLPRVIHWAQDRSVAPFATPNSRQIWAPPWTEYVALNLLVLLKGDRLVNLVQWFAAIAALIVVSRIAALAGLHREGQIASALVAATIPMLIDEASTLMTDGLSGLLGDLCRVDYLSGQSAAVELEQLEAARRGARLGGAD
jgi:hypothetical protein